MRYNKVEFGENCDLWASLCGARRCTKSTAYSAPRFQRHISSIFIKLEVRFFPASSYSSAIYFMNYTQSPQGWKKKRLSLKNRKNHHSFQSGKSGRLRKLFGFLLVSGILLAILGVGGVIAAVAYYSQDLPPVVELIERRQVESSKIYDRTGEHLLFELHGDIKRTFVKLDELPEYVAKATLSIEDKDFYFHKGVNFRSIVKALYEKLTKGGQLRGASTITQQLVKNAILTNERSFTRKFKEALLAFKIEREYTKDEILELYLNEIPYGSVVYGVEAASQTFFDKSARDLTPAEAAVLAALPKAPTYYSPYGTHTDELFIRQRIILDKMAEQGYITAEEAEFYKKEELHFSLNTDNLKAPHFVMYVRDLLAAELGESFLEEGGLTITTTLDMEKQQLAEDIIKEAAPSNKSDWNAGNAALVSMDANTGQVLAMVGSVDFFDTENDGQVNVALSPRQPGSSFKPIVYTAAFQKGYTPETVIYDVATNFKDVCIGDPNYEPNNYSLREYGPVTFRKALQGSLNISAVKVLYITGIGRVVDLAEKLGYSNIRELEPSLCLSLVLGGAEVKLLDHVSAYSVFAQEGMKHEVAAVLEVRDKSGRVLLAYDDNKERVLDRDIVRMTNDVLSDNDARAYIFGANSHLHIPGRDVAAKTGTTQSFHDSWTLGYTPSLVTGVWVGNNDNTPMKQGASLASPIWNKFMVSVLEGTEVENFAPAPALQAEKPVLRGVVEQEIKVSIDKQSGKLATEFTPPRNIEEKVFHPIHSILHYLDKDNPNGPVPTDPTRDQQYEHWEAGIIAWALKQDFEPDFPPTEYDDIHTAALKPNVKILSPNGTDTISDRNFHVDIKSDAPLGIVEAEYYIDDVKLTSVFSEPFDLDYILGDEVRNGFHALRVYVYDDLNNFDMAQVELNFLLNALEPSFRFNNLSSSAKLKHESFPYAFSGNIANVNSVRRIEIRYKSDNQVFAKLLSGTENPQNPEYSFTWESSPGVGEYDMYAVLTDTSGKTYQSNTIRVEVRSDKSGGSEDEDGSGEDDSLLDKIFNRRES